MARFSDYGADKVDVFERIPRKTPRSCPELNNPKKKIRKSHVTRGLRLMDLTYFPHFNLYWV